MRWLSPDGCLVSAHVIVPAHSVGGCPRSKRVVLTAVAAALLAACSSDDTSSSPPPAPAPAAGAPAPAARGTGYVTSTDTLADVPTFLWVDPDSAANPGPRASNPSDAARAHVARFAHYYRLTPERVSEL